MKIFCKNDVLEQKTFFDWNVIQVAIASGNLKSFNYLIKKYVRSPKEILYLSNMRDCEGRSVLHLSTMIKPISLTQKITNLFCKDKLSTLFNEKITNEIVFSFKEMLEARDNAGMTALHYAINNEDEVLVKFFLSKGASNCAIDRFGNSPLHLASLKGNIGICQILLNDGAWKDSKNSLGRTPLVEAICNKKHSIVRLLLSRGSDINTVDINARSILHHSIIEGLPKTTEYILPFIKNIDQRDSSGTSCFHLAAAAGDLSLIRRFTEERKEIVDSRDLDGCCALFYSGFYGHFDCVKFLLSLGCSIDSTDKYGNIPLFFVATQPSKELFTEMLYLSRNSKRFTFFQKNKLGLSIFHFICLTNNDDISLHYAKTLFKLTKSDKKLEEICDDQNKTPIHYCAQNNLPKTFIYFHQNFGWGITSKDENGLTPFHLMAQSGNSKFLFEFFTKFKNTIDIDEKTNNGNSALHLSCFNGNLNCVKILCKFGANLEIEDSQGNTPLHIASYNSQSHIVSFLLEKKAKIDCRNKFGMTPLSVSCLNGNWECSSLLIQNNSSLWLESTYPSNLKDYFLPIHLAICSLKNKKNIKEDHQNILKIFEKTKDNEDPNNRKWISKCLQLASFVGYLPLIRKISEIYPNNTFKECLEDFSTAGNTPLSISIHSSNVKVSMFLLHVGASLDAITQKEKGFIENNPILQVRLLRTKPKRKYFEKSHKESLESIFKSANHLGVDQKKYLNPFLEILIDVDSNLFQFFISPEEKSIQKIVEFQKHLIEIFDSAGLLISLTKTVLKRWKQEDIENKLYLEPNNFVSLFLFSLNKYIGDKFYSNYVEPFLKTNNSFESKQEEIGIYDSVCSVANDILDSLSENSEILPLFIKEICINLRILFGKVNPKKDLDGVSYFIFSQWISSSIKETTEEESQNFLFYSTLSKLFYNLSINKIFEEEDSMSIYNSFIENNSTKLILFLSSISEPLSENEKTSLKNRKSMSNDLSKSILFIQNFLVENSDKLESYFSNLKDERKEKIENDFKRISIIVEYYKEKKKTLQSKERTIFVSKQISYEPLPLLNSKLKLHTSQDISLKFSVPFNL